MFRYLPGIVLVQVVTLALLWVNAGATLENQLLRVGLPALIISGVTALWLSMIGRMETERRNTTLREQHATEVTRLNREIERARADVLQQASADKAQWLERAHSQREQLVKQTHKELLKRERGINRAANLKVGLAFMSVTAIGVIMLITELLTLGLLTIMTAGGAMGGYLFRWRQTRQMMDGLGTLPSKNAKGLPRGAIVISESTNMSDKEARTTGLDPIELDADDGSEATRERLRKPSS